jgi:hypothetical protein
MFRGNWRDLGYWRWWWRSGARTELKVTLALLAMLAFLGGGFVLADGLSATNAGAVGGNAVVLETTIQRLVTVRERGKAVVRRVPVVRRVFLHPSTAFETRFDTRYVTTPGGTREIVKLVPVVKKRVVTVNGKTRTVVQTRLEPTTHVRTQTNVVTDQQTVEREVTVVSTHVDTVVQPVTETVTRTETQPLPAPVTVTVTETLTETLPTTVTITLPLP